MKRACSLTVVVLLSALVPAQNLVPNGGFEEYTECPDDLGQITRASGWFTPFNCSPDYFNVCAPDASRTSVPFNAMGYQHAANGNGYAGVMTFLVGMASEPNFRKEVMAVELTHSLSIGQPVHVSFKVACAGDGNEPLASMQMSVQGIGIRFSTVPVYDPFSGLPNDAAIWLETVPTDTTNWIFVDGIYTPDSAYRYLQLGVFFDDSLLTPIEIFQSAENPGAYAFVDEVCVSTEVFGCATGDGIPSLEYSEVMVWPTVFDASFTILTHGDLDQGSSWRLLTVTGIVVIRPRLFSTSMVRVEGMESLADGVYLLQVISPHGGKTWITRIVHVST